MIHDTPCTGRPIEAEMLDGPPKLSPREREARRLQRREERGQYAQAVRVLRVAGRKIARGRAEEGLRTLMEGFGQILADAAVRKLTGRD